LNKKLRILVISFLIGGINAASNFSGIIAENAAAFYKEINESPKFCFLDPSIPLTSNSLMWEVFTEEAGHCDGRRVEIKNLKLKPGIKKSEAIKDLFTHGGNVECRIVTSLVTQLLINKFVGDNTYDAISGLRHLSTDNLFADYLESNTPCKPGEFGYITNVKEYLTLHPQGRGAGENVCCVGDDQFYGFGYLFKIGPKTKKEILDTLYALTIIPTQNTDISMKHLQVLYALSREFWDQKREEAQASCYCWKFYDSIKMFTQT
jgi:hypothetical protein